MVSPQLEPQMVPLVVDTNGVLRVRGSRVSLDTVLSAFKLGATAEEIVLKYSTLQLADVYAVLAYYLHHRSEVEAYLRERRTEAGRIRGEIESRFDPSGVRERLLARGATAAETRDPAGS